jgi:hypothetical protein
MNQPNTLEETIHFFKNSNTPVDDISSRGIRNSWGLWSGSELANWFYNRQIYHADDMSGIIIDSYERYLNNKPINLDEQVKNYHNHWEKCYGKNHLDIMFKEIEKFYKIEIRDKKIEEILL